MKKKQIKISVLWQVELYWIKFLLQCYFWHKQKFDTSLWHLIQKQRCHFTSALLDLCPSIISPSSHLSLFKNNLLNICWILLFIVSFSKTALHDSFNKPFPCFVSISLLSSSYLHYVLDNENFYICIYICIYMASRDSFF